MTDKPRITQNKQVLGYLRLHGSITPQEAMESLACYRLGARIHELRKEGYNIAGALVKSIGGAHFAKYTLITG
jgi:hypothetical protein